MSKFRFVIAALMSFAVLGFFVPSDSSTVVGPSKASASGTGGPIVLDGMDPVCHSGWESTGQYIAKVLKKLHDGAGNNNNGHIAIIGSNAGTTSCGASWATQLSSQFLAQFPSAPTIDFYVTDAEINSFFSTTIASNPPAVLWIPDNWSRSSTTEGIFTTNAEKIADYVNSGGGLFANSGSYGWLTALLPSAVYNSGGCNGGPEATADGIADFGLSNTLVAACWHGYFTGNVGTLKTLVDYPYPGPGETGPGTRKAVSIGGGSVSLPSSFTLAISPTNPVAGQPLTITATAQTLAGVPQPGVSVMIMVSSGPDAGQMFTATTNSSGIATFTINTASVGSNTYTATATVNGVAKTTSVTTTWSAPPATTTIVVSTTTETPTTTTEPEQTTTAPTTEPEVEIPTTTHDHGSHGYGDHQPDLPNTGRDISRFMIIMFVLIGVGLTTTLGVRRNNK